MFNGGTLLCLIFAVTFGLYLAWPWILENLVATAPETDTLVGSDLREQYGADSVEYRNYRNGTAA